MNNVKKTTNVEASRSLALWTGVNYSGSPLQVSNAQAGILAADVGIWDYKSVGISAMQLFVWSAPDTATPGYSFSGHIESLLSTNQINLPTHYPTAEFPLQFLGINPLEVGVLFVSVDSRDAPVALAFSQTYPNSSVPLTTFAAQGIDGALGFFSLLLNSSNTVAVQYGDYSIVSGSATWTGNGSLTIEWNGNTPVVAGSSSLPIGWRFGIPAKQNDGSWLLTLSAGTAANTGTLYTGTGFTGSSKILLPHTLTQLNSGIGWTYHSLKLSTMPAFIYSSFSPTNASYVYSGYQEQLLTADVADFATSFTGSTPVNLLSLDNTDVIVQLMIITQKDNSSAWIMTQPYPQAFYTFASTRESGLLAILPASGDSQQITLSYGSLNGSGYFTQTGTTTLSANLENGVPTFTPGDDWPATLQLSAATQLDDGSWNMAIADSRVVLNPALYPQVNYGGTPQPLEEHQVVELRTLADLWQYDSLRLFGKHWLSSTLFDPQSSTYDYRKYRDSYSDADVPDISKDYPLASAAINGIVLGDNDVVVEVQLQPQDTSQNAVLSASQSWPQAFYTAAAYVAGIAQPGVFIVFDKTQSVHTIPIQLGSLNADGTASWETNTTLTARWDNNLAKPVLVLGQDAPSDFTLSPVQSTGLAGEFTTALSFDNSMKITMYPITHAPSSAEAYSANDTVVLYSNKATTVTLQLLGGGMFRTNNQSMDTFILPARSMTPIEIYSSDTAWVTVILSADNDNIAEQRTTVSFVSMQSVDRYKMAVTSGAPAATGIANSIYVQPTQDNISANAKLTLTLSGNAVFSDTKTNVITYSFWQLPSNIDIVDNSAETVSVVLTADSSQGQSLTTTFVHV
ncbi:hypothetical protein [Ewingella americana]